jgi:flagellar biosynthesis/type III secretory pathway chaperone
MPEYDQKAILGWRAPSGKLNLLRDQISEITSRCRVETQRNGIQVRRQSQYIDTALNILRGDGLPSTF